MSYMSVDGARSATKHAGVAAIETSAVLAGKSGLARILAPTEAAQKLKVLSYTFSPSATTQFKVGTSGATISYFTGSLWGAAGIPYTMPLNVPFGYFTTEAGDDLVVSSTGGIAGSITYMREY